MISLLQKNIRLYRSLEEYTDDLSSSALHSDVKLENLSRAFAFLFLSLGGLFAVFIIAWLWPTARRLFGMAYLKIRLIVREKSMAIKRKFSS